MIVAGSPIEAVYIGASELAKEPIRIKKFISILGFIFSIANHIEFYCDNNRGFVEVKELRLHQ